MRTVVINVISEFNDPLVKVATFLGNIMSKVNHFPPYPFYSVLRELNKTTHILTRQQSFQISFV